MKTMRWAIVGGALCVNGCSAAPLDRGVPASSAANVSERAAAGEAIAALRRGDFDRARTLADAGVAADRDNPYPRLVRAIARFETTTQQLGLDGRTLAVGAIAGGALNQRYLRETFGDAERELAAVDEDLAIASRRTGMGLELCPACWEVDWNHDGVIDDRDRFLLQVEQDEAGRSIPEGDPRRRPTFRFDDGDVLWARAFVSYERALLDLVLAYDWGEVGGLSRHRPRVVVRLVDRGRVAEARRRILEGLDLSDATRRAYLAETDDDREWVPNPSQRSHPLPLHVDAALYTTWEAVVGDLRRLVNGEEGLAIGDLLLLAGARPKSSSTASVDVGRLLTEPRDIVLDVHDLDREPGDDGVEVALAHALGDGAVRRMRPSPLPRRLLRMTGEIDRHEEGLERKLRYLFWLN